MRVVLQPGSPRNLYRSIVGDMETFEGALGLDT